jgi:hypothetical protein
VGGGLHNRASGEYSAISGGYNNQASGNRSAIPGGLGNQAAGKFSFAAGRNASALHDGCFVWNDTTSGGYESFAANQFLVHATGGIYMAGAGLRTMSSAGPSMTMAKGTRYMDNSIVAWAKVSGGSGDMSNDEFGVTSVVRNSNGNYTITVDVTANSAATLIPMAIAEVEEAPNSAATARLVTVNQTTASTFDVYITNGSFTPTNNDFIFMVTAR